MNHTPGVTNECVAQKAEAEGHFVTARELIHDPLSEPCGPCESCGVGLSVRSAKVSIITLRSGREYHATLCEACESDLDA